MLIVCGLIDKKYLDFSPVLVVEILSPSTALKDRHNKFIIYQQQQIKYYVIVSPEKKEVEVYTIEDKVYSLQHSGTSFMYPFSFNDTCFASIDFSEIW